MRDAGPTTRRRLLRATGLAGATTLSGCVGFGPFEAEQTADGSGEEVTAWAWNTAARALETTVEPYLDRTPADVRVVVERMDHDVLVDDLHRALVTGSGGPDVSLLESVDAPRFVETGGLADLSDRIEGDLRDEFVAGAWESFTRDGEVYALPWDVGPVAVFYNRDRYEEHGIDPGAIETWDQFVEEGQTLPEDVAMINLPPDDLDRLWRMGFRQLGGQPFTEDGQVDVHSEPSLRVARTIQRLAEAGVADQRESWSSDWYDAHGDGAIASLPAGPWMEWILRDVLEETGGQWGVYPLPAYEEGGNRATNWGGSGLCLPEPAGDEGHEPAWDYVQWTLRSPEMQNAMYQEYGIFPALEAAYEADYYDEELAFFGGQPARRVFADLAPDVPGYSYSVDTPAVSDAMNEALGAMLDGEHSPQEALRRAAERVAEETGRELA